MAERIGIFGGTFDPIHVGHLVAAVNARPALELDRVLLVVANTPWQKADERPITAATERLALVEAAVAECDGLEASAIEIERGGPSYSADTVAELRLGHPQAALFLIVGADVVAGLTTWERVEEFRHDVTLVVVNRPGSIARPEDLAPWRSASLEIPRLEISSTDLRERAANGRPLDYLVPDAAIRVIRQRGLYAVGR